MADIHPTAIVEDGARLGADVKIGPFCTVGPEVKLGDGVELISHVALCGDVEIGDRTVIYPFVMIGAPPQDLSYRGGLTNVVIGSDCIFRESATVHRGTEGGRGMTSIGDKCFFMIGSHVGHDCEVGDHVIFTNNATLGGHCQIGDHAILAGFAAVQQRLRIGTHAFIGGLTGVSTDVIPFGMALGNRAFLAGLNVTGLKRRGFDRETIFALRDAYREMFHGTGDRHHRIDRIADKHAGIPAVQEMVRFLRDSGERRLCMPRKQSAAARRMMEDDTVDA